MSRDYYVILYIYTVLLFLNSYILTNTWESLRREVTAHAYNYKSSCDSITRSNFKKFVRHVIVPVLD